MIAWWGNNWLYILSVWCFLIWIATIGVAIWAIKYTATTRKMEKRLREKSNAMTLAEKRSVMDDKMIALGVVAEQELKVLGDKNAQIETDIKQHEIDKEVTSDNKT